MKQLLPHHQLGAWQLVIAGVGVGLVAFAGFSLFGDRHNTKPVQVLSSNTHKKTTSDNLLEGQWGYLPGTVWKKGTLQVLPTGAAIVNQDGSGGQPNPGVNVYGTRLQVGKQFSVRATLARPKAGTTATFQLYGQVPIIADEFRVERASLALALTDKTLVATVWDGTKQSPALTRSFTITPASTMVLGIVRDGNTIDLTLNDAPVGSLTNGNIFASNQVWFGASAAGNDWRLTKLTASSSDAKSLKVIDTTQNKITPTDLQALQLLVAAKRPGFSIGAAMALGPLTADDAYARIALGGGFGQMTTENALKWQFVHPAPNIYSFQEGDAMVALAKRYGLAVHGHTLVFGEANPRWVQDLPVASDADKQHVQQVMTDHINTVVGHYKGKVATWDVVNEPLADYDNFDGDAGKTLREHKWYQAMGESYIAMAFNTAHAADPNAQLFMNEYGLEADGERWDTMLALVTKLKAQGVPIDGVGFQAHVYEAADKIDPVTLKSHIQQLAAIGVKSRISEMDVYSDDGVAVQNQQYAAVLQACLSEPTCVSFTTWGITDRYDYFKDDDGSIQQGQDFLWDKNLQPTPAVAAMQQVLR